MGKTVSVIVYIKVSVSCLLRLLVYVACAFLLLLLLLLFTVFVCFVLFFFYCVWPFGFLALLLF